MGSDSKEKEEASVETARLDGVWARMEAWWDSIHIPVPYIPKIYTLMKWSFLIIIAVRMEGTSAERMCRCLIDRSIHHIASCSPPKGLHGPRRILPVLPRLHCLLPQGEILHLQGRGRSREIEGADLLPMQARLKSFPMHCLHIIVAIRLTNPMQSDDLDWRWRILEYVGINALLAFSCTFTLYLISPAASGSGIPDVKVWTWERC